MTNATNETGILLESVVARVGADMTACEELVRKGVQETQDHPTQDLFTDALYPFNHIHEVLTERVSHYAGNGHDATEAAEGIGKGLQEPLVMAYGSCSSNHYYVPENYQVQIREHLMGLIKYTEQLTAGQMPEDHLTKPEDEQEVKADYNGPVRVGVVDDEDSLVKLYGQMLSKGDSYEVVVTASTGEEAMTKDWTNVDVVILDNIMKGGTLDGPDTYVELRKQNPNLRGVMFSGTAFADVIAKGREAGINVEWKPFPLIKLEGYLDQAMENYKPAD